MAPIAVSSLLIAWRARGVGVIKLSDERNSCGCGIIVTL